MPYALVGVIKGAKVDAPESVACIRDGFATKDEAYAFGREFHETPERKDKYGDLYAEPYGGERWVRPFGGRCFYYARRTLYELREKFRSLCPNGIEPCVRYGERDLIDPDGKTVRGRHGWVEAWNTVFDCGSYVETLSEYRKDDYYKLFNVVPQECHTYDDIKQGFD